MKGKFSVKIPIYHIDTELYIGKESVPSTMKLKVKGVDGSVQTVERGGTKKVVIYMKKMDWTTHDIGLLVHELYHVVNKIYLIIGVQDGIDEEFWAYMLQYLTREYSEKINKKWIVKLKSKKK